MGGAWRGCKVALVVLCSCGISSANRSLAGRALLGKDLFVGLMSSVAIIVVQLCCERIIISNIF